MSVRLKSVLKEYEFRPDETIRVVAGSYEAARAVVERRRPKASSIVLVAIRNPGLYDAIKPKRRPKP